MATSDWITIIGIAIGLFVTTMSSWLMLAFKFGSIHQEVKSTAKNVEKNTEDIAVLKEDVAVLKKDVAVLKEDVAWLKFTMQQVLTKLDILLNDNTSGFSPRSFRKQ